jgi:hypothetical protein
LGPVVSPNAAVNGSCTNAGRVLFGEIRVYPIWFSVSGHPWTTAKKNVYRALFNTVQTSPLWKIFWQYPDKFGRVPRTLQIGQECDTTTINADDCGVSYATANVGISGCALPIDTNGIYATIPSSYNSPSGEGGGCHSGVSAGGGQLQTTFATYFGGFQNGDPFTTPPGSGYYTPSFSTTLISSFTQPAVGDSVAANVATSGMAAGQAVEINNGGTLNVYTIESVTDGTHAVFSNTVNFTISQGSGTTIASGSNTWDLTLAAEASKQYVVQHELYEAISDPQPSFQGWTCTGMFGSGNEIADGCAVNGPSGNEGILGWSYQAATGNANWQTIYQGIAYDMAIASLWNGVAKQCANSYAGPPGVDCSTDADCQPADQHYLQRCVGAVCVNSSCSDGFVDGDESDVDCGGWCASPSVADRPCATGKKCRSGMDCASETCSTGTCN